MTTQLLEQRQKCPRSPTKRQFPTMGSAQDAAEARTRETGIDIQAYACPDCGFFHLSRTSRLDRVLGSRDGTVVTVGMARNQRKLATEPVVKRVDMSEVMAMEAPIVPANAAAREKMLAAYAEGRETVTMTEVMEALSIGRQHANEALHALGWQGRRGQKEWYPPGVEMPAWVPPVRPRKEGGVTREERNRRTQSARGSRKEALLASRQRKLAGYLRGKEEVSTREIMELLDAGKDTAKAMMRDAGWNIEIGPNARWRPADAVAPRALHAVEPLPDEPAEVAETAPISLPVSELDRAVERHPAHGAPLPASVIAVPVSELGWRDIPDLNAVKRKLISQMIDELSPYGIEVRIQIREKR